MINIEYVTVKQGGTESDVTVVPGDTNTLAFTDEQLPDPSSAQASYDKIRGILTITTDYQTFEIPGFMTAQKAGIGQRGKKGIRGPAGRDGRIGHDGRPGKPGCAGPTGEQGNKGTTGAPGEDGPRGATGKGGCIGPAGPEGLEGPMGPTGPDGPRGASGPSCIRGERGPTGQSPINVVVVSDEQPTDPLVYLWARPIGPDDIPSNPSNPEEMLGTVLSKSMVLSPTGSGQFYQGTLAFVLQGFSGGTGPFTYEWSGAFLADVDISYTDTGLNAKNLNLTCRVQIPTGTAISKNGTVTLLITDKATNKTLSITADYSFSGSNTSATGGMSSGCIVYGQRVDYNGAKRPVENILVGDAVDSLNIEGLPDSSNGSVSYLDWYTDTVKASSDTSYVRVATHGTFDQYYVINDELHITREETLFACRRDIWQFIRVVDLREGDYLYHKDGDKIISSIRVVEEPVSVVSLDVETVDTYFVEGYLVHNLDTQSVLVKK